MKIKKIIAPIVIALFAISPIIIALIGNLLAYLFDCNVSGASGASCARCGEGLEEVIGTMVFAPWFIFFTIPLSVFMFTIYGIVEAVQSSVASSKNRKI